MSNTAPPLRTVYYNPTWRCNLRCKHCWVEAKGAATGFLPRPRSQEELTAGQLEGILDQAKELGLQSFKFTGGEPLLRDDFGSLYRIVKDKGIYVSIETNGTIEPPGTWEVFREMPPDFVSVSLDSADEKEHDEFRGADGCWRRTVEFSQKLNETGIRFQIIMSIVSLDPEKVRRLVDLAELLGADSVKINLPIVIGRGRNLRTKELDISKVLTFVEGIYNSFGPSVLLNVPPAFVPIKRLKHRAHCRVKNLLGILSDGRTSFCGVGFTRPELVTGNALKDPLEKIWCNTPLLGKLREEVPAGIRGICRNCVHLKYCLGHCVMENYVTGGSFDSPNQICRRARESGLFPRSRRVDGQSHR